MDVNAIRSRLERERKQLNDELEQLNVSRQLIERRDGGPFGRREEAATETMELERQLALARHTREQLAEVEHALEKLEKGTYGLCDCCGKTISLERIEAIPQTSLCLDCKVTRCKQTASL